MTGVEVRLAEMTAEACPELAEGTGVAEVNDVACSRVLSGRRRPIDPQIARLCDAGRIETYDTKDETMKGHGVRLACSC